MFILWPRGKNTLCPQTHDNEFDQGPIVYRLCRVSSKTIRKHSSINESFKGSDVLKVMRSSKTAAELSSVEPVAPKDVAHGYFRSFFKFRRLIPMFSFEEMSLLKNKSYSVAAGASAKRKVAEAKIGVEDFTNPEYHENQGFPPFRK